MRLAILLAALTISPLLAGASCTTRPEPPERSVVVTPEITYVEVPVYRGFDEQLTRDCLTVPEGTNSEAFTLLALARKALADCTARMREIRARQGARVSAGDDPKTDSKDQ